MLGRDTLGGGGGGEGGMGFMHREVSDSKDEGGGLYYRFTQITYFRKYNRDWGLGYKVRAVGDGDGDGEGGLGELSALFEWRSWGVAGVS